MAVIDVIGVIGVVIIVVYRWLRGYDKVDDELNKKPIAPPWWDR